MTGMRIHRVLSDENVAPIEKNGPFRDLNVFSTFRPMSCVSICKELCMNLQGTINQKFHEKLDLASPIIDI